MQTNTPSIPIVPYMAWNRLENRPRRRQFERVLKAEIHDPLWMIGRQWQMGEFKGNDAGSGILARAQMDYFTIGGVSAYGQPVQSYNQELPLEPLVESVPYKWSIKECLLIGQKWLRLLEGNLTSSSYISYKALFGATGSPLLLELPVQPATTAPDPDILASAELLSNNRLTQLMASTALAGLKLDGGTIYRVLKNATWSTDLQTLFPTTTSTALAADLSIARTAFLNWMEKMYTLPDGNATWDQARMEYQFDTHWPLNANQSVRLSAPSHHQGHFDWYAFSQTNEPATPSNLQPTRKALQLILSQNRFAGMPSSRWWEFENGGVNFCDIDGNTTDIAKVIVTQFALVYQDDWFVIPYKVPVGSYSDVKGIVVTDVFGVTTFVANYPINGYTNAGFIDAGADEWKSWRWMDMTRQIGGTSIASNAQRPAGTQVIFPVVNHMQHGAPIESVAFVRDEVADLVWAIEKTVPDGLGRGVDGYERVRAFLEYLQRFKSGQPATPTATPDPDARIRYELNTTEVPENWIPFVPVHVGTGNRDIQFQRAAMPRILDKYEISLVRPHTELLRSGLGGNYQPYYINEEEVTRAGIVVETSMQRTRWYNGKVVSWVGRRKMTGRGHGLSSLTYDRIEDVEQPV